MRMLYVISSSTVLIIFLLWFFRYDTYCDNRCVAYDRLTGNWVHPHALAIRSDNEIQLRTLMRLTEKPNFKVDEALAAGYSYDDLIEHLRDEYKLKKEKK